MRQIGQVPKQDWGDAVLRVFGNDVTLRLSKELGSTLPAELPPGKCLKKMESQVRQEVEIPKPQSPITLKLIPMPAPMRPLLALLVTLGSYAATAAPLPDAGPAKLPRWRGFNLLEKFIFAGKHEPFREDDFRLIAKFGFNFVRLPMDYRGYIVSGDWNRFDEEALGQIDQAVAWGRQYGIHVCLNLHRAPGWTVAKPAEAKDLWSDAGARQAAARHWAMFARRYKGIPNKNLSFNLFNEPSGVKADAYLALSDEAGKELWRQSLSAGPEQGPWRKNALDPRWKCWQAEGEVEFNFTLPHPVKSLTLRVVDGDWLTLGLLGIRASEGSPEAVARLTPSWDQAPETLCYSAADPSKPKLGVPHDRAWLRAQTIPPWQAFAAAGGGVMVGEWGAYQKTPHPVVLGWAEDCLRNWQDAGWGWALWNFRGSFGIFDSGRKDVTYETFEGHQLDRKYLELLQRY